MNVPSEVAKTIEYIDEQIGSLQQAKRTLLKTFGTNGTRPQEKTQRPTRRQALMDFLQRHGPATRAQIKAAFPSVPNGTLAYLLNEKQGVERNTEGLWTLKQQK